jgi:hypothetical protein
VDWLFDKANRYVRLPYVDKHQIFTLVDPNAGGLSNYTIASFVISEGFMVVRSLTARGESGGGGMRRKESAAQSAA